MPMTTATGAPLLTPEQVHELIVLPVQASAVAAQASTPVVISSPTWRAPRVTADPSAAWVSEGQEIPLSAAELDELEVTPRKVAGLVVVSRELADDTSPEATSTIGDALVRDVARKIDDAYLRTLPAPAPPGLSTVDATVIDAGALTSLDAFVDAAAAAEDFGADITSWITSSTVARRLAKLRKGAGSAESLLATDPATPARRVVEGRPLLVSPSTGPLTVWGVPAARTFTVIRDDARVDVDGSAFFTSDQVAVRCTMRVAFGIIHPPSIIKVTIAAE